MGKRRLVMKCYTLILVILFSTNAFAEQGTLDKLTNLSCEFPITSVNDWSDDAPEPVIKKEQKFAFRLESIDTAKGTAKMVATAGAAGLIVIPTPEALHFMETMPSGNLNITTVFSSKTKDGKFKAVHSRHMQIGDPLPSQAYGFCRSK